MQAGPGFYTFTITANDTAGNIYSRTYSICVIGVPPSLPQLTTSDLWDTWAVGASRNWNVWIAGGVAPYTWSVTGLPAGVSLRTNEFGIAEIWGNGITSGVYPVTVTAVGQFQPSGERQPRLHFPRLQTQLPGQRPVWSGGHAL